jgi:hypothetical protein
MNQFADRRDRLRAWRRSFAAALDAMDYKLALACQMEIDKLERELDALEPHVRLMIRQHRDYYREKAAQSRERPL